ncbi:MAG TPA: methylmalonyl Co-A mutase-associated GTPase MeaB [Dehalococcoidia bacterium]|nr:methylmalonyl Co-A mutase-associated GTPase MeaB [Dehalococcoidia bacterium]
MTPDELIEGVLAGNRRALARAITFVENDTAAGRAVLAGLYGHTGRAKTVGVTGSAGVGKSTLSNALAREERARGRTVGIVAVDPSSPFSHGAILGDRIRMQELTSDGGVFLRSMASRGSLGGLSETSTGVVDVLDAAGYDVVLLETVGAGQDEVEVATATQTTVLVTAPSAGDDVQAMKAGLMEIAQVMVINKADLAGADTTQAQLRSLLSLASDRSWKPPIVQTIARGGDGVSELVDAIDEHHDYSRNSEHAADERRALARAQIISLARISLAREALTTAERVGILDGLTDEVAERRQDPRTAAESLLAAMRSGELAAE